MPGPTPREILLECYREAVAAVDACRCVQRALERWRPPGVWHAVAVGKAAGAMMLGAARHFEGRLVDGLLVTKAGHVPADLSQFPRLRVVEASHPTPDASSLRAGEFVAEYLVALPRVANLLFLVSGGASSLVERLAPGVTLEDLRRVNAWALASGRAIDDVNAVRRAISAIKGGGLARLAGPRRSVALFVSDVPRDDPTVIASGLLHSAGVSRSLPSMPAEIAAIVSRAQRAGAETAALPRIRHRVVASLHDATRAASDRGKGFGLEVLRSRVRFAGDAAAAGRRFARTVRTSTSGTLHVWGGESTIILPAHPGYGGRNQHLALAAAQGLAGVEGVAVLSAGTDGIDGVTGDAGAIVDGGTVARGADAGFDAVRALERADSGRFLEASGDLLHTGPTLTNVGDLVLGLKWSRGA